MSGQEGNLTMEQLQKLREELLAEEKKLALMKQVRQNQASGVNSQSTNGRMSVPSSSGSSRVHSVSNSYAGVERRQHLPPPPPLKELRPGARHAVPSAPPPLISQAVLERQKVHTPLLRQAAGPSYSGKASNVIHSPSPQPRSTNSPGMERTSSLAMRSQRAQKINSMQQEVDRFLLGLRPTMPPQYSWSLVPSVSSPHLVAMVGLEECVRHLEAQRTGRAISAEDDAISNIPKPVCQHCKADYAPFWRSFSNDDKEMVIVCENCDWLRVKYPFVQQHRIVLTDALSKVADREEEIAQLMKIHREEEELWLKEQQKSYHHSQPQYWKEHSPKS